MTQILRSFIVPHVLQRILTLTAILVLSACATTSQRPGPGEVPTGTVLYAWTQLGEGTSASARAITSDSTCPTITLNGGTPVAMTPRVTSPPNFTQILVCEYDELSSSSPPTSIFVGDQNLPLPPPTASSDQILVLGDTGCREKGSSQQSCTGPPSTGAWGFPQITSDANGTSPDVILHVGDYLYRETDCPEAPCGYDWPAWEADFFEAAENGTSTSTPTNNQGVLRLAPWILLRGNHESCSRAYHGYFLFFGEGPWSDAPDCPSEHVAPYKVALDELDVYVVDTSSENASYAKTDFKTVAGDLGGSTTNTWLATHVPVLSSDHMLGNAYQDSGLPKAAALKGIHVGHIHLFEHTDATSSHQAETITGGSGTKLDSCSGSGDYCYGGGGNYSYLEVTSTRSGWDATVYGLSGKSVYTFSVPPKRQELAHGRR